MRRARARQLGQGAVEFALVSPVLLALLIGLLESGLLLFSSNTANFAAAEAARAASERGDAADADTYALGKIQATSLGSTSVLHITEVDIYRVIPSGVGTYVQDPVSDNQICGGPCMNRYNMDGTTVDGNPPPWDPSLRKVTNSSSDYLAVTIQCQYNWLTGFYSFLGPVALSPTFYVRLEPQDY